MVQMKVGRVVKVEGPLRELYIPHGSDESHFIHLSFNHNIYLYIPHGSDESEAFFVDEKRLFHFISHMVQMKD